MPEVPEELDVFHLPHVHMKKLVQDIEYQLSRANFSDSTAYHCLLDHLRSDFSQLKTHEEIENQYIMRELLPRVPTGAKTTLKNDLHSDNRLSDLVLLVDDGLRLEYSTAVDRQVFGEQLKVATAQFTVDYIPHMEEEEEVFLPLLVEYFSENELKQLTQVVVGLHHLEPEGTVKTTQHCVKRSRMRPSLLDLPPEIILTILSFLSPADLLRLAPLHSSLHAVALDSSLWQHLHPVRWARGHLKFFKPLSLAVCGEGEGEGLSQDMVLDNDITKELLSVDGGVNANLRGTSVYREKKAVNVVALSPGFTAFRVAAEKSWEVWRRDYQYGWTVFAEIHGLDLCTSDVGEEEERRSMEREARVLLGLVEHILPRVGGQVWTLDLAYGKAVSNEMVFRMLRQCPNLHYLDLSHTGISDFAFRGLLGPSQCSRWKLEYVNLTGCSLITDTSLQRLSQAFTSHMRPLTGASCLCSVVAGGEGGEMKTGDSGGGGGGWKGGGAEEKEPCLKCLILSGCHLVTNVGLRALAVGGGLPRLEYLDLSGLPNVSERGLNDLVTACPRLKPELLFYCDNITDGPYAVCANGCQNVGSGGLCCRDIL